MFKKVLLALCLTAFMSWAQDDEDDDGFVSAPAAAEEDDDDGFVSAPAGGSHATMATADDEDEDFGGSEMTAAQRREQAERKKFEEEQRLDEYANSERRRDWLRNRLIFQIGMGSRYPIMGETGMGMGLGAGLEYILPFHFALYGSFGFLPKGTDNDFDEWELEGGTGYKVGLNYYLFPKNPLHLGLSFSYGTVYFDHDIIPVDNVRPLIKVNGYQFDLLITYLTNEWYYLQFSIGMYYAPKLANVPNTGDQDTDNPSFRKKDYDDGSGTGERVWPTKEWVSKVVEKDGMSKTGIVFGIAIGYALPELFPDDTEKRRREREKARERSGIAGR
ncbi:autotransporter outer membrane beta-barrel domain-containing protein [uncultured Fibrobacter sp.]|jgi:hypothetical protein|uniref:autotransporter outer membrane beta-barrel domain-containing protein n=1 Tax=uncultured Fibrobacter sp. TaxID=261512 RepID=UPI00261C6CA4|nr:autotransporter outer membrane beta-barrel domain-containing protein [uncultured Fibrobacter sp.]